MLFRNKIFGLRHEFGFARELFVHLVGADAINLLDRYGMVYTQMKLIDREMTTLISMIDDRITKDFKIIKQENSPLTKDE
jgi:hypothetical protein